jgi:hypothetical protein
MGRAGNLIPPRPALGKLGAGFFFYNNELSSRLVGMTTRQYARYCYCDLRDAILVSSFQRLSALVRLSQ